MLIPAPEIKHLEDGFVKCSSCSAEIPLNSSAPLEVINCPNCPGQVLIPLKVKNYWLYSPLGGGGMGSVYKAVSNAVEGKEYAVKVLPRNEKANQDFIKALLHEGEIGTLLGNHPNIIGIVEYGVDGDEHFLVTEFIDGDRLDLLLGEKNQIPEKKAIGIILQILEAEIHILKCGYLFRDLKPQNIIIDKTGTVRLFDYGLCATITEAAESNLADEVQGSPFYIPPERIMGAPEGEFSEIYSLGMILFYMLSGRTYYSLAEINDLVTKHLTSLRALSVETYLKKCTPTCIAIVDRMIARTPAKRYQDFASLKSDLEQLQAQLKEPVVIIPSAISGAFKKSFGKRARLAGIVSGAALLVAVLAGVISWGYSVHQKKLLIQKENLRIEEIRRTLMESVAAELGVPADVKAPALDSAEISRKIEQAAKEAIANKTAELKPFNEQESRKSICKTLNINPDEKISVSIDEVKKKMQAEIKAAAENEVQKIDRNFNEDAETKRIASEMKIELPVKDPSASLKDVDAEFKTYIQKKVDEKYSTKAMSAEVMEIGKKYAGYQKGDNIEMIDVSGISIKGAYGGKVGNKVIIGGRQILLSDLPSSETWKFSEGECEARIERMTKQHLDEFKIKKEKYRKDIESSEKPEYYKKYGYFASADGTFKIPGEIIKERIKKLKETRQDDVRKKEKSIRDNAESKFDKAAYMKKNHLREVDGVWRSEAEVVELLLAKEKAVFESRRKIQLDSIREIANAEAEKQVYSSNGYVFHENKWQPARKLIDDIVARKIKEEAK
ncbi:MAG: protein kinase [Victivallales bacterium]|jgi:serine/threonine-protein kinase